MEVSLQKLGPIREALETGASSLERMIENHVVDVFERKYKTTMKWTDLRNPAALSPMRFWFPHLELDRHAKHGCEKNDEFTVTR